MQKDRNAITIWLVSGATMVAAMVLIGGITRLTHSGLSMTDWKLIMGMIPPMNEAEWKAAFEQYKQFPEFLKVNSHFTLDDFKAIFFWEWLHRFLGRLIGIVFILPFIVFIVRKSLRGRLLFKATILLGLGALQGFLGWFMVKSGLVDRPSVSHYRLAIHLMAAFITFCYIFWVVIGLLQPKRNKSPNRTMASLSWVLMSVVSVQIVFGAFVAGLKAGLIYPTFPKMGTEWVPDIIITELGSEGVRSLFSNIVSVQFVHRTFAYLVIAIVIALWWKGRRLNLIPAQRTGIVLAILIVILQFTIGVFTILFGVPISLALAHQFGALILLTSSVYLVYHFPFSIIQKEK